jgi:hypothetical protein
VCVDDVDVLEVETLEGGSETLDDMLPREAVVVYEDLAIDTAPI